MAQDKKRFKSEVEFHNHLKSEGTAPTLTVTTAGNGACAIDSTSTDTAGTLTFTNTWDDSDTVLVTFNKAYDTAPKVLLGVGPVNGSGASLVEIDTIAITTTGFTLTASGTCAGALTYFVIETV
jgi:hypothetical protein